MMEHRLKLKFDDSFNGILFATQGDTARVFIVELCDEDDKIIDPNNYKLAFFVAQKDEVTKVDASIESNKFVIRCVNTQFKYAGKAKAQFVLYNQEDKKLASQIFELNIEESIENGATVGVNVLVDFEDIKKAKELLEKQKDMLDEGKIVNKELETSIGEGRKVSKELKESTSTGQNINTSLIDTTTKANEAYTKLEESRGSADTLNSDLKANIAQGNKTNANLQASISTAKNTQSTLQEKTAQGIDTNTKLGKSIKTGQDVVSKINAADKNLATSVGNAETAKTNLDASVGKANTTKTNLDASIDKANTAKKNLDTSTSQGNATDSKLRDTDTKASTSISTLQDLLNQSTTTEQNLKDIIASGNLDKYVTEPKLQEALAKIKTLKKEVVDTLPSTGQDDVIYLVKDSKGKANNVYLEYLWINGAFELIGSTEVDLSGYATLKYTTEELTNVRDEIRTRDGRLQDDIIKSQNLLSNLIAKKADKTEIKTKLSEMTDDSTHRLVTDAQKSEWDDKVDKVDGKGLSTNDFTDEDKSKLGDIDLSKYVTDENFTSVANKALGKSDIALQKSDAALQKSAINEEHINQVDKKATDAIDSVKKVSSRAVANSARIDAVVSKVQKELSKKADRTEIADFKRCKVLTQAEYDALSSTEKDRADTLYFIKA